MDIRSEIMSEKKMKCLGNALKYDTVRQVLYALILNCLRQSPNTDIPNIDSSRCNNQSSCSLLYS